MVFRKTKKRNRLSRKLKRLSKQTGGKIPFSKLKKKTRKKTKQLLRKKRKHFRRDSRPDPKELPSHKKN